MELETTTPEQPIEPAMVANDKQPEIPLPEVVNPPPEAPAPPLEAVEAKPETPRETVVVDREMFARMVYALIRGFAGLYTGRPVKRKVGQMLGAKTFDEENRLVDELTKGIGE